MGLDKIRLERSKKSIPDRAVEGSTGLSVRGVLFEVFASAVLFSEGTWLTEYNGCTNHETTSDDFKPMRSYHRW
jgi:hypothetical protein